MSGIEHSAECKERMAQEAQVLAEFFAQHPDACQTCYGSGGREVYWPATRDEPEGGDWVDCECLEDNQCPWCGAPLGCEVADTDTDDLRCGVENCGWEFGVQPARYPRDLCPCEVAAESAELALEAEERWGRPHDE